MSDKALAVLRAIDTEDGMIANALGSDLCERIDALVSAQPAESLPAEVSKELATLRASLTYYSPDKIEMSRELAKALVAGVSEQHAPINPPETFSSSIDAAQPAEAVEGDGESGEYYQYRHRSLPGADGGTVWLPWQSFSREMQIRRVDAHDAAQGAVASGCDWPAGVRFSVQDEPGEHDPCYLVMPGGGMLALNHHAKNGVDQARAAFIANACNAFLANRAPSIPDERMDEAIRILCGLTGESKPTDDCRMDHLCDTVQRIAAMATHPHPTPDTTAAELLGLVDRIERRVDEIDRMPLGTYRSLRASIKSLRTLAGKIKGERNEP